MLTPKRHSIILKLLKDKNVVNIQELVEATSSSESTIRRDLSQLEEEKKLKRVHGGASLLHQKSEELSISEKSTKNLQAKQNIAQYAADLIRDGDCIYLDAGTTTYQMIPFLKGKEIIVVTNGLTHLDSLLENRVNTYLTGGFIKQKTRALIGSPAVDSLKAYRFDKCFLGVNGVHADYGYTTPDPEEAAMKRVALSLSQDNFILCDQSKLNEVTFSKIADINEAMIITNQTDKQMINTFSDKTIVKVVTA